MLRVDRMEELVRGLRGPPGVPGIGKQGRPGRPGKQGIPGILFVVSGFRANRFCYLSPLLMLLKNLKMEGCLFSGIVKNR